MKGVVSMSSARSRNANLDLLRILSAYLVIICHTIWFIQLNELSAPVRYGIFMVQAFSKIAVPVYFMITGCTLLTKSDSIRRTLQRLLRIACVLIVFSIVQELLPLHRPADLLAFRLPSFLEFIYRQPAIDAYWYLYAYIAILLMMPLLQKLVKSMSKSDFAYFFAISFFVFGIWPVVVEYTPISEYTYHFTLPLFSTNICYLLMGYAFIAVPHKKQPAALLLLLLVLSIAVNAAFMNHDHLATGGAYHQFMDNIAFLPMLIATGCFFALICRIPLNGRAAAVCTELGRCSFGAYLLCDLFLEVLAPVFYPLRAAFGQIPALLLYQLLILASSVVTAAVLRRLPLLRKIL